MDVVIDTLKKLFIEETSKSFLDNEFESINEYKLINGHEFEDTTIFSLDIVDNSILKSRKYFVKSENISRSMHKYYLPDSDGEVELAKHLEANKNILLFTKLKKDGFEIQTPYGSYTPD